MKTKQLKIDIKVSLVKSFIIEVPKESLIMDAITKAILIGKSKVKNNEVDFSLDDIIKDEQIRISIPDEFGPGKDRSLTKWIDVNPDFEDTKEDKFRYGI